jgi:DNA-binding NarL/FixJ family response regulator
MAASGLTSPRIADELFLSPRTVDNHLRSIYRKLGLSGRAELGPGARTAHDGSPARSTPPGVVSADEID